MPDAHDHPLLDTPRDGGESLLEPRSAALCDHPAPVDGTGWSRRKQSSSVALSRFDPELREAVDGPQRAHAERFLLATAARFPAGPINLAPGGWPDTTFALLLLSGSLVHETRVGTGRMIAFLSSGDVLMPPAPDPHDLPGHVQVTASEEVLLAALDQAFLRAAAAWPQLMIVIQRRLGEQQHRLAVHGAICQLPRVEQRVLALMWHLAARFGRVTADGVIVTRPLNHQTLADLVGARRPTVTLALKALREGDHLRRRRDGTWLLARHSAGHASLEDLLGELRLSSPGGAEAPQRRSSLGGTAVPARHLQVVAVAREAGQR